MMSSSRTITIYRIVLLFQVVNYTTLGYYSYSSLRSFVVNVFLEMLYSIYFFPFFWTIIWFLLAIFPLLKAGIPVTPHPGKLCDVFCDFVIVLSILQSITFIPVQNYWFPPFNTSSGRNKSRGPLCKLWLSCYMPCWMALAVVKHKRDGCTNFRSDSCHSVSGS